MTLNRRVLALVVGLAVLLPTLASASPLISFSNTTGQSLANGPFTLGWEFTADQTMLATDLGLFDDTQDGLVESHAIGLWNSAGTLLASTVVGSGTSGTLIDKFRYASITPILLLAGQNYLVGAVFLDGNDPNLFPGTVTGFTTNGITFVGNRFIAGASLADPTVNGGTDTAYFGPNINATAVPEPTTMVLLGTGVATAWIRRRRAVR